jgi:hypothetical protein
MNRKEFSMSSLATAPKLTDDLERELIAQEVNQRYGQALDSGRGALIGSKADTVAAAALALLAVLVYLLAH